ncbi:MAG TPA: ribosome maturation factor RimM [Acidimicrobiales bacterium]|nr:ribosome maturation factor RimM [Acidimicrobiales bacterium]
MADVSDGGANLLEVGRVTKPHGLRGEVVVKLLSDRAGRLDPGAVLSTERGDLVVRSARPHQDRWIVAFEGRSTREHADELRGTVLRAEPVDDPDELWVHQLVGAMVVTTSGEPVGRCTGVIANPAADLIELDGGALVPVVFVVEHSPERVVIDPPDGLFEL